MASRVKLRYYIISLLGLFVTAMDRTDGLGYTNHKFKELKQIFRENFELGLERGGASFAVFHNGELVVDLYGGVANPKISQFWTQHSLSVLFSTTKSVSATILAYVLDNERVSYNEKVSKYWPEYGRNGKEDTTILNVVLHQINFKASLRLSSQAGIPYSEEDISREDVQDWRKMSEYFENATPVWKPGTRAGYHALTIGFLIDQLVRRIDSKRRGVVDVFNEDFRIKYNLSDISIGLLSKCQNNRVATVLSPSNEDIEQQGRRNPEALRRYQLGDNAYNKRLYSTWSWITTDDYNELENRLLPMPSNMGIGNARGLAQFHSLMSEKKILSQQFYEQNLSGPVLEEEMDVINGYPESKGYGWQFSRNPRNQWIYGHSGFGGQNVRVDVHNSLSFAYVTNDLKIADADQVEPWKRLVEKLYELL